MPMALANDVRTLNVPTHLILSTILGGRYCYAHFSGRESEAMKNEVVCQDHAGRAQ